MRYVNFSTTHSISFPFFLFDARGGNSQLGVASAWLEPSAGMSRRWCPQTMEKVDSTPSAESFLAPLPQAQPGAAFRQI